VVSFSISDSDISVFMAAMAAFTIPTFISDDDAGSVVSDESSLFGDIFAEYTESQEQALFGDDPYLPFMAVASLDLFLKQLKDRSRNAYLKATQDLIHWACSEGLENDSLRAKILKYLVYLESLLKEDGTPQYCPGTMKTFLGIFKSFFEMTGNGDLCALEPILKTFAKKWEKTSNPTKATPFTKENLQKLYALEDNPETILLKAYAVIAISFAARVGEMANLTFEGIKRQVDDDGEVTFRIGYQRAKRVSSGAEDWDYQLVTGHKEVKILSTYVDVFDVASRTGRFFRKLKRCTKTWKVVPFFKKVVPIGRNTLADFSKRIAQLIGLTNFQRYTSHAFRRSTATILTDAGRTLAEIKNVTGHLSDKVVQGYIANSVNQKRKAANDLAGPPAPALRDGGPIIATGSGAPLPGGITFIVNYPGSHPV
jgi:site-specific recombinase XerD